MPLREIKPIQKKNKKKLNDLFKKRINNEGAML